MYCYYILRLYSLSKRIDIRAPNYTTDLTSGNTYYQITLHAYTVQQLGLTDRNGFYRSGSSQVCRLPPPPNLT